MAIHSETEPFPLIDVEGPPAERGLQYGRKAGERIGRSIAIYSEALAKDGLDWPDARRIAGGFIPGIEAHNPAMLEEIRAIATGADVPVEDIVALNARTELLYGSENAAISDPDGCTGAIALGPATADGRVLHGQNWDWKDECADSSIVLRIRPESGPDILSFVEAGVLARCGLNSAGIALTGNFLQCEHDSGRDGVPIPFVRRKILEAQSLADAVRAVMAARFAFSNNMMISHAGGEAVDLEVTPVDAFWLLPEDDLLVHANHFISAAARARVQDVGLRTNTDSLYRDRRVRTRLEQDRGAITIDSFKQAFQDRYGSPKAVCRTPVEGPGGKTSSTVATVIMDAAAGKMWLAPRPYGPHRYTEYSLS